MKKFEIVYTDYIYVEVPDGWNEFDNAEEIMAMAIEQHEQNPDGHWEVLGEVE
jgi:hypothetical protein